MISFAIPGWELSQYFASDGDNEETRSAAAKASKMYKSSLKNRPQHVTKVHNMHSLVRTYVRRTTSGYATTTQQTQKRADCHLNQPITKKAQYRRHEPRTKNVVIVKLHKGKNATYCGTRCGTRTG